MALQVMNINVLKACVYLTTTTIHVRAIGENNLRGDVDVEILQHTNGTIQDVGMYNPGYRYVQSRI